MGQDHVQPQVLLDILQHLGHVLVRPLHQAVLGLVFPIIPLANHHADIAGGEHGHLIIKILIIAAKEIVAQGLFQPLAAIMPLEIEVYLALGQIELVDHALLGEGQMGAQHLKPGAQLLFAGDFARQQIVGQFVPQDGHDGFFIIDLVRIVPVQAIQHLLHVVQNGDLRLRLAPDLKDGQTGADIVEVIAELAGLAAAEHVGDAVHALGFHGIDCLLRRAHDHRGLEIQGLPLHGAVHAVQHRRFVGHYQKSVHAPSSNKEKFQHYPLYINSVFLQSF